MKYSKTQMLKIDVGRILKIWLGIFILLFVWVVLNEAGISKNRSTIVSLTGSIGLSKIEHNRGAYKLRPALPYFDAGEVVLHWTAPGDDGYEGRAEGYDVRYQPCESGPIDTESKWQNAIQVEGEPQPSPAGQMDSMIVSGLEWGESYYFCIKSFDEEYNLSGLSNSPLITADTITYDFIPGDANGNGVLDGSDVIYLVSYLKGYNQPPNPLLAGDANGDCLVIGSDVIYLVMYFKGIGPQPIRGDCKKQI